MLDLSRCTALDVARYYRAGGQLSDEQIGTLYRCGNTEGWNAALDPGWCGRLLAAKEATVKARTKATPPVPPRHGKVLEAMAFSSQATIADYARRLIGERPREVMVGIFLDPIGRVLATTELAQGSATSVPCDPRSVVAAAKTVGASNVIVAHNHPATLGAARPSTNDKIWTAYLGDALAEAGLGLLDHFVVTRDRAVSLLALGVPFRRAVT